MDNIELGSVISFEKGKKPIALATEPQEGYLPYVDIEAFETGTVKKYTSGEKCLACEDGDILIVCDGSRSGLVGYAIHGFVGSTLAKISCEVLLNQYLFYFLQGKYRLFNTSKKGTGTPHLNPTLLRQQKIVVPSIEEQQRIVTRIEELFSELDSAVETLQKTRQQLEVYRQAVLKEAFDGTLNKFTPQGNGFIGEYIYPPRYGTSKKCGYLIESESVPVYRIPNIDYNNGCINHDDIKYASFNDRELDGLKLESGDILIIRSNGSVSLVGRAAMVQENDTSGTFAGYLMRLRIVDKTVMNPQFLLWFLKSHEARIYIENKAKSTSGVHNINSKEISDLCIPIFTYHEQCRIIEEIESRISICDSIEKTVNESLQQAEAMRQSILKKAFEGNL